MEHTFDSIRGKVIEKGFMFFDNGDYNLNFIWERTNDEITNQFTDYLHVLYYLNQMPQIISIPATTKPGLKGSIDSPITYEGITGTAVIIPGQYKGAWRYTEGYSEKHYPFNYPYFEQVKGINYWRDGNKDLMIDQVQEQDGQIFYTHWHAMSNMGASGFPVNNWSMGCMGAEEPQWRKIIEITREAVKKWGYVFTGTIIE